MISQRLCFFRSSGEEVGKVSLDSRLIPYGEHQIQSIAVLRNYLFTTFNDRIRVWDRRKLNSNVGILAGKHASNIMCLATAENVPMSSGECDVLVSGGKDHYVKVKNDDLYISCPIIDCDMV